MLDWAQNFIVINAKAQITQEFDEFQGLSATFFFGVHNQKEVIKIGRLCILRSL